MSEVTLGGDRLGSGNKQKQYLHNYERSTHDLSYTWRSTLAPGTLVPFMSELALPGDTFDIELDCDILTHPTVGPLFGSYKVQLDVFQVPIRLYQPKLHMNMLGIGLDMQSIKLPGIRVTGVPVDFNKPLDNQQINPSCILSYLGIRGVGINATNTETYRIFNAVPFLGYWDIFKQYYANKQEENAFVIHKEVASTGAIDSLAIDGETIPSSPSTAIDLDIKPGSTVTIIFTSWDYNFSPNTIKLNTAGTDYTLDQLFGIWNYDEQNLTITGLNDGGNFPIAVTDYDYTPEAIAEDLYSEPKLWSFPLAHIDEMRTTILQNTTAKLVLNNEVDDPYGTPLRQATIDNKLRCSQQFALEGLAVKTYDSDLFNNWIDTDFITGSNGVDTLSAITVTNGTLLVNEVLLGKKIYDMLMRVAVSGGTYDDWIDAVYTHERQRSAENPMYIGGLIKTLVFQEVIAQTAFTDQPLGQLAGRGKLLQHKKGGNIIAKIDEPSYLIGIISLTPKVDYSQGNKWDVNLENLDDLHKPGLDQIGFQDLIADQMAWFSTLCVDNTLTTVSVGKQPAWINYMTNVNRVFGNFADPTQQSFMVLNRNYSQSVNGNTVTVKDLTTYIDPAKFNYTFADTRRDAQNFWGQISVNMQARRKMSAKSIPNL